MNPPDRDGASAEPLGPIEDEFVTDPAVFRRAFWLLLALAGMLVALGFLFANYDIELWAFGGFAAITAIVVRVTGGRMVAGRLTLHPHGVRYNEADTGTAIRWDEIDRVKIVRIPIKMEGLVTVDYNYEITVYGPGGRTIRLRRAFLDQIPGGRVKGLVKRFGAYEAD
jgi:hypothetical protein